MRPIPGRKGENCMRRLLVGFAAALLLIGLAGACGKKKVDLVNGVPPVSGSLASIAETLDRMAVLPPGERGAYLERTWPHLDEDVVYFLRRMDRIPQGSRVDRVEFRYGSLNDVRAESRDGERYGYFENQIVALVHVGGVREPIAVIVQCLNGTFALLEQLNALQPVGSHVPQERFAIGPREGLIHHVDFPTAIAIAERHALPLYRGRDIRESNRITPAEARQMESTTDRLQVTVYVVEGDRFDLASGTFPPSPRRGR
ncbi:MAG: hypothetical protein UY99_C0014G0008 [Parcubacteria group bacterium GW2011_GWA1_59_11]|nr:MAG: hypothetical protein UY99_C0014G0008 [Parcubacteria group bacterium GW2011_GWA1_59_11]